MSASSEHKEVARRHRGKGEDRRRNFSRKRMRQLLFETTAARYISPKALREAEDSYIVTAVNLVSRSVDACQEGKTLQVKHAILGYESLHRQGGYYSSAPIKIRGASKKQGQSTSKPKTKKAVVVTPAARRPSSEGKEPLQKRVSKDVRRDDDEAEASQPPPAKKVAVAAATHDEPVAKPASAAPVPRKRPSKQTTVSEPEAEAEVPKGRKRKQPARASEDEEVAPPAAAATKRSVRPTTDEEDEGEASQESSAAEPAATPDILTLRDDIR